MDQINRIKSKQIVWIEPNHRNDPPLHVANRGQRFSTVTGVTWLNQHIFLAAHRNGLAIAAYDIRSAEKPLILKKIKHLSDDIAAYQLDEKTWEIIVSGCWEVSYTKYLLSLSPTPEIKLFEVRHSMDKTFCHGVDYDDAGNHILSYHTGLNPRIEYLRKSWKLPKPWGARDTCFDPITKELFALSVSTVPKLTTYNETKCSIWKFNNASDTWELFLLIGNMHADALCIYGDRIWLNDQYSDQVAGYCLKKTKNTVYIKSKLLSFPHGISVSNKGVLAITNYGNSSIVMVDISEIR
jgi:hypothetical protein